SSESRPRSVRLSRDVPRARDRGRGHALRGHCGLRAAARVTRSMPALARFASTVNLSVPPARAGEVRPLALGSLSICLAAILARLAGVTNYPFRTLCRGFGAGLYVSEMITARGFLEGNSRTHLLASSRADEWPRSVQIYGSDPVEIGEMARRLAAEGVQHI